MIFIELNIYPQHYGGLHNYKDKEKSARIYCEYNLCRTQSMFEWNGLPDTIPQREFELMLQTNGSCIFTEVNGKFYVFTGGLGGERNVYYIPTEYVVANPYLKLNKIFKVDEDCVFVRSDSLCVGLLPLFERTATIMVENDITMIIQAINTRMMALITATTSNEKTAADEYIKKIIDGDISAVMQNAIFQGIKTQPYASRDISSTHIELQQYIKAAMFNDIGLDANYNMKRESLSMAESQMNDDALAPFVDNMLSERKLACEKINSMYGLNISVDFSSTWKQKKISNQVDNEVDKDETIEVK